MKEHNDKGQDGERREGVSDETIRPGDVIGVKQAASILGMTRDGIYKWVRLGKVRSYSDGTGYGVYLNRREIEEIARQRATFIPRPFTYSEDRYA